MKFITNIEWTRVRTIVVIVMIILLSAYLIVRSVALNNRYNEERKPKPTVETDKSFC